VVNLGIDGHVEVADAIDAPEGFRGAFGGDGLLAVLGVDGLVFPLGCQFLPCALGDVAGDFAEDVLEVVAGHKMEGNAGGV
jgi:hypothetical protein